MRANWVKTAALSMAVLLLTTGCWDAKDIEEKDISTFVVVDKTQDGYSFLAEIAKPQSSGTEDGGALQFLFLKSEGSTYAEAREDIDRKADKSIYLGATSAVVLTEKLAEGNIEEYVYRLREISDYRKTVDVLVTPEPPEAFGEVKSKHGSGVGMIIEDTLQSLADTGQMFEFNLADILESLAGPCKCFLLPNITAGDSDIELSGYSVFDSGKCIGFIPAKEGKGVILLLVKDPRLEYVVPFENGRATVGITIRKKGIKPFYSGGKIRFNLDFYVDAELRYTSDGKPVTDEMDRQITEQLQNMILKELEDTVETSFQKHRCDYLDFFNVFRIAYPVEFRNMDWHQEYPKAETAIQVKVDLETTGSLDFEPRIEH